MILVRWEDGGDMRFSVDAAANAAYISLLPSRDRPVSNSVEIDAPDLKGSLVLDFDADGRLVGIEILNASEVLPDTVLNDGRSN